MLGKISGDIHEVMTGLAIFIQKDGVLKQHVSVDIAEVHVNFLSEEESYEIYTTVDNFISVKDELEKLGYTDFLLSEVTNIPNNYVSMDEETKEKVISLVETLEDLDDVQNVYHNMEM